MPTADESLANTSNALSDFRRYAADFTSLSAWMGKLFLLIPLADFALQVGPNWPNVWLGKFGGSIACGLGLMFCFLSYDWQSLSQKKYSVHMAFSLLLLTAFSFTYITLHSMFVVSIPDQDTLVTTGYTPLPQILEYVELSPNHLSAKDLLEKFHEAESIWTLGSLTVIRLSLLCSWLFGWVAFTLAVGVFIISQWKKTKT
ncbi:hypothetical protein [Rhodopirellula sallentina]|nr:hypothetical protein [Rhodopirellula sallentina]